ncbi:hypothetical protein TSMEX_007158, partial [Taenia solium]
VDQDRLKLTDEHALADLCPPEDGDPNTTPIALNAVSNHVSASIAPPTPPSLLINYVTVKPDCHSCPTLYVAAQASTRRLYRPSWQAIWNPNVRVIFYADESLLPRHGSAPPP